MTVPFCARLHAAAFGEPPVADEEWQPSGELAQKNILLAIRHIEHSSQVTGSGDLFAVSPNVPIWTSTILLARIWA